MDFGLLPVDAFATLVVEYAIVEFVVAAASLAGAGGVGLVEGALMARPPKLGGAGALGPVTTALRRKVQATPVLGSMWLANSTPRCNTRLAELVALRAGNSLIWITVVRLNKAVLWMLLV